MALARSTLFILSFVTTLVLHRLGVSPPWQFTLAALTIIPLAGEITAATNRLARELGPLVGGLINASAANLTELILTGLSLAAGLVYLVQAAVLGAILSNTLLVLGLAMVVGGANHTTQRVNPTLTSTSSSQLVVGLTALLLPSLLHWLRKTGTTGTDSVYLNVGIALILLATYALSTWYALTTGGRHREETAGSPPASPVTAPSTTTALGSSSPAGERRRKIWLAAGNLVIAALAVGWVSEVLVHTVQDTVWAWGLRPRFVGLIVLPFLGNAVENVAAVLAAREGRMTLAYEIAIGSSTQIALFVLPLLVLLGLVLHQPLTFAFPPLEILALTAGIALATLVYLDSHSNWLEGAQLLATYGILALVFLAAK
ncbi:MAG: calcium/proton exchanger [Limnochordaceae bacterium]|nr:calcium/proton exchanger [Limnochordaceae bacterium]